MIMDDSNKNKEEEMKSYIDILNDALKELPNIVLPSMGMIDNEEKVDIDGMDYFIKDSDNQ